MGNGCFNQSLKKHLKVAANRGVPTANQGEFSEKLNEAVDKYLELGSNPVMGPIADGVERIIPNVRGFGRLPSLVSIIYDTRQYNQGEIEKWQYDIRLGYNTISMVSGIPTTATSIAHEKTLGFLGEFSVWLENYVNNIPRMYYGW